MPTSLYLIAPPAADDTALLAALAPVLAAAPVAALLLPRRGLADAAYGTLIAPALAAAQRAGCAVLVEGEPGFARAAGADGLHVDGSATKVRQAIADLKPAMIVGTASAGASSHDAMTKGELGVDYIMFGPLSGTTDRATRELARWWAEAVEVPAVLSDPEARADGIEPEGCEFIALGDSLWAAPEGPAAAIAAIARALDGR